MDEVLLRPYRPTDFEALYKIDHICFPRGIAYGRAEMKFYLSFPHADCFVAEQNPEIAGFIIAEAASGEGHIITLDVLPKFRRAGVGTGLLRKTEDALALRGIAAVWLETATTNEAAIAFWKEHGYRESGEILRGYYGRGGDAYQMLKQITTESVAE